MMLGAMCWARGLLFASTCWTLVAAVPGARTPIMGYNSYNQLSCVPDEQTMTDAIHAMAERGFVSKGYEYFQIDCGWSSRDGERNATTGSLKVNQNRFSNGLEPLSELARAKGMRWSMYSDAGYRMCDLQQIPSPEVGSLYHEAADARYFASLKTEYLKYDNCYANGVAKADIAPKGPSSNFPGRFSRMWTALQQEGISSMLVCQWGVAYCAKGTNGSCESGRSQTGDVNEGLQGPESWTSNLSTSFRISDDIARGWSNIYRIYNQAVHVADSGRIGPGHFGDMDLLEVGNRGMTGAEQATHFAAWALLKSALMISTNVSALSEASVRVVQNEHLIRMNQDRLGQPVRLVQRWTADRDVWAGPLEGGDVAVLVVDLSNRSRTLEVDFLQTLDIRSADVLDAWTGEAFPRRGRYAAQVAGHGSLALRLSRIKHAEDGAQRLHYIPAAQGTLSGGAYVANLTSSGTGAGSEGGQGQGQQQDTGVRGIGGAHNGTLTVAVEVASAGGVRQPAGAGTRQTVRIDYINCAVSFAPSPQTPATNVLSELLASVAVNRAPAALVSFPLSGYDCARDVKRAYRVELDGFDTRPGARNVLTFAGAPVQTADGAAGATTTALGPAPDILRLGFLV